MQEKKTLDENSKRLVDINATKGKNSRMQIMCKNGYKLWHKIRQWIKYINAIYYTLNFPLKWL